MPRNKPRRVVLAILYRVSHRLASVVGRKRFLGWALDLTWAMRRIAWEQAGIVFGERFHNEAMGLSEEKLREVLSGCKSVLDIGCGTGRWSRVAASYVSKVVGVDYDPRVLSIARERTNAPNVSFQRGDVTTLDLGRFDVALAIHVLEHIDDPVPLLSALRAVASTLVVEVPDFDSDPLNRARLWADRPFYTDSDHVREYTLESLRADLVSGGWNISHADKRGGMLVCVASHP